MEGGQEEKRIFGALTVYRERGAYLRRRELYHDATKAYDEALRNYPEDVSTLIGRSLVSGVSPKGAVSSMADAMLAMQLQPKNLTALNVQANAMFTMTDFEKSTMTCHRGRRARKQPSYFSDGVIRGEAVIEECIGKEAGQVMLDFLPIISQAEAQNSYVNTNVPKSSLRVSRIPNVVSETKLSQNEVRRHELLSRVLAMKYLGPMANDKFFLQSLEKDPAIFSANSKGSHDLKKLINDTLHELTQQQELLRTQRPYYSVKLAEKSESKHQSEFKKQQLIHDRMSNLRTANILLKRITTLLQEKNVMKLMTAAKQLQSFLNSKSPRTLPGIEGITERLYRLVGKGYLCQYRLSYTLSEKSNRRRVAFLMGLSVDRPSSYDSVHATYPLQIEKPKHAYEIMLQELDICENDFMRCWLLYELARLSILMKNYAMAKFYAQRCQRLAQEVSSPSWWLNGCIMLLTGDMQQGNLTDIRIAVEEAYKYAMKLDNPNIQRFLKKCYEMATEVMTSDENKAIVKREKAILSLLDKRDRSEAELLLKHISMLPPGRRFSVLPKKKLPNVNMLSSERRRAYQPGISILHNLVPTVPIPRRTKTPGTMSFVY